MLCRLLLALIGLWTRCAIEFFKSDEFHQIYLSFELQASSVRLILSFRHLIFASKFETFILFVKGNLMRELTHNEIGFVSGGGTRPWVRKIAETALLGWIGSMPIMRQKKPYAIFVSGSIDCGAESRRSALDINLVPESKSTTVGILKVQLTNTEIIWARPANPK